MSDLKDKVILITGGTSGIGVACTELFGRQGAKVVDHVDPGRGGQGVGRRA